MQTVMMTLTLKDLSVLKGALRLSADNSLNARCEWLKRSQDEVLSAAAYEQAVEMMGVCEREWQRASALMCEVEMLEDELYDRMADAK